MPSQPAIQLIDTGFVRPGFDAAYLIIENRRAAFIDCGTAHSVPAMLAALSQHGLQPADVDWLILTHVHLDHAGGAGALLAELPVARLAVHPRGVRHMIDPSQLWAGASAVYGEEVMRRDYGQLLPIAAERVVAAADGFEIELQGRRLICLDTPGHARHHIAIHDPAQRVCFTGDTFGLSYREFDHANGAYILPTTTPVQFDPPALHQSIDRIVALDLDRVMLTHFGPLGQVADMAQQLHRHLDAMVALALELRDAPDRHQQLSRQLGALYLEQARQHGWRGEPAQLHALLGGDIELNSQGLEVWLDRPDP